jgi:hypothetical protein
MCSSTGFCSVKTGCLGTGVCLSLLARADPWLAGLADSAAAGLNQLRVSRLCSPLIVKMIFVPGLHEHGQKRTPAHKAACWSHTRARPGPCTWPCHCCASMPLVYPLAAAATAACAVSTPGANKLLLPMSWCICSRIYVFEIVLIPCVVLT